MNDFDLEPQNWKSERDKPKEPIFGPGWPIAVGIILSIFAAAAVFDGTLSGKIIGSILGVVIMGAISAIYF